MKPPMDIRLRKRNTHSFLNDTELPIQAMHQTSMEIGYAERLYLHRDMLYFRLPHRFGLGWMGAQKEKSYPDAPKTLYRMWLLDMDYVHPFMFSHRPATFTTSFHGQWTQDSMRLYGVDMVSMGNRYFKIGAGIETMPEEIIHAFGILKKAAARANRILLAEKMRSSISALTSARSTVMAPISITDTPSQVRQSVCAENSPRYPTMYSPRCQLESPSLSHC